ncbi:MAG: flagellar hook-length control protein FliK [Sulfuricurvum sp.]|jgi:hypothetical protein|uniref:flagellar hook-length control protein FliK n=1 Tax=Sulfuricurvum sp. TaxID=2025608 RepID=UPI0025D7DDBB|nr:flagellar hook-length control protein FliK [Sulfuricurvum sp.]MCK9373254.1 flagellar hook-length control protein FliK [Sulfuricurvum sp.]
MIHLNTDSKLTILMPHQNKALAEAIKNATPQQLDQLREGKDVKSLLTSVFHDKTTASKSDQTLLEILKNGAAFKNMGNVADELKTLVTSLKNSPDLALKSSTLEGFAKKMDSLNGNTLKTQMDNSGIFMESKIGSAAQIVPTLQEKLQTLQTLLTKSTLPEAKKIGGALEALVSTIDPNQPLTTLQSAETLTNELKKITDSLQKFITKGDVLYSKEMGGMVQKLDLLLAQPPLSFQEIKATLSQLYGALLSSAASDANALLDTLERLLKQVANPSEESLPLLKELSVKLRNTLASGEATFRESGKLAAKLGEFSHPNDLLIDKVLQESMEGDLKSGLMKLSEELQNSTSPHSEELLKQVDKLLTQIDYHQLLSALDHSTSLYFPFEWDQLENGSLAFKKVENNKFYCEINLQLKEYGELNLLMALYDKNQIEIQAHTETPQLKTLLQENVGELRGLLIDAGLSPRRIRFFEMKESPCASAEPYGSFGSDLGFEVKV